MGDLEQEKIFTAVVGVCSHAVADKISQVIHASIELLLDLVDGMFPTISKNTWIELNKYIDTLMLWLLDKLGDNNNRIREQSKLALQTIVTHPVIGVYTLVEKITKGEIKATAATSHRHVLGWNQILSYIVQKYKVNTDDVPLEPVLAQALYGLKNWEEDVRVVSYRLMFDIYKVLGKPIKGYLN